MAATPSDLAERACAHALHAEYNHYSEVWLGKHTFVMCAQIYTRPCGIAQSDEEQKNGKQALECREPNHKIKKQTGIDPCSVER